MPPESVTVTDGTEKEKEQKEQTEKEAKNQQETKNAGRTDKVVDEPTPREKLLLERLEAQGRQTEQLLANQQRLEAEISGIKKANEPPPKSEKEKNDAFWVNPTKVLQEALDETVKPLKEFVHEVKSGNTYTDLKNRYKNDPKYKEMFDGGKVEGMIDELMSKNQPSDAAMKAVIFGVRGAIEMGEIPGVTLKKEPPPKEDKEDKETERKPRTREKDMIPPHLRPSAPPGSREQSRETEDEYEKRAEDADENMRRLAREANMSVADYLRLNDVKPLDVVSTYTDSPRDKAKKASLIKRGLLKENEE